MRPPLVRHSSRIKLFTRNRNRNTFHPLQPIHPSSEERENRKRKKIAVIFVIHRNESFEPSFEAATDGSSGTNFSKNRFRITTAGENFDSRKVWRRDGSPRDSSKGGCETRRRRREGEEGVVLIRSSKTFPLDDRLFSETRRDATRGKRARFLHPWRSWKIEGREKEDTRGC